MDNRSIHNFEGMRILILMIAFLLCVFPVNSQPKVKTHLFKDKSTAPIPFINPTFQYSQIAKQFCTIPGIRAGVIFNNRFLIGGVYNMTLGDIALPASIGAGKLQMKWGGVHLEYTLWPLQVVHLTIPLSAGIGQMKITESANETLTGSPNFYIAEPGLMIEINVWKYAKLGFGGSYRYTANVSYNSLTTNDLNGFSVVASVKFGMFNNPEQKKNIRDPLPEDIKIKSPKVKKANSPHAKKRKSPR